MTHPDTDNSHNNMNHSNENNDKRCQKDDETMTATTATAGKVVVNDNGADCTVVDVVVADVEEEGVIEQVPQQQLQDVFPEKDVTTTTTRTRSNRTTKRRIQQSTSSTSSSQIPIQSQQQQQQYCDIPTSQHYQISFLHRTTVTCLTVSNKHGYIITGDSQGMVKFWYRLPVSVVTTSSSTTSTSSDTTATTTPSPCIEFVKSFTAHFGAVLTVSVDMSSGSNSNRTSTTNEDYCISIGVDDCIKLYDVATFDVVALIRIPLPVSIPPSLSSTSTTSSTSSKFVALSGVCTWITTSGSNSGTTHNRNNTTTSSSMKPYLAVASKSNGHIYIVTPTMTSTGTSVSSDTINDMVEVEEQVVVFGTTESNKTTTTTSQASVQSQSSLLVVPLHGTTPVTCMAQVPQYQCVVSCDTAGIIEVWDTSQLDVQNVVGGSCCNTSSNSTSEQPNQHGICYSSKLQTDLYRLVQLKVYAIAISISSTWYYALYCSDHILRILQHSTGTHIQSYNDQLQLYDTIYDQIPFQLDGMEYSKRAATEREIMYETTVFGTASSKTTTSTTASTKQQQQQQQSHQKFTFQFDPTGRYLIVPTMMGIQILDWQNDLAQNTKKKQKKKRKKPIIIPAGPEEELCTMSSSMIACTGMSDVASGLRYINVLLATGPVRINTQMQLARGMTSATTSTTTASSTMTTTTSTSVMKNDDTTTTTQSKKVTDTVLIALAYNQRRLYVYSHIDPILSASTTNDQDDAIVRRDVWNEAPTVSDRLYAVTATTTTANHIKNGKDNLTNDHGRYTHCIIESKWTITKNDGKLSRSLSIGIL
jgi:hypothetical protein